MVLASLPSSNNKMDKYIEKRIEWLKSKENNVIKKSYNYVTKGNIKFFHNDIMIAEKYFGTLFQRQKIIIAFEKLVEKLPTRRNSYFIISLDTDVVAYKLTHLPKKANGVIFYPNVAKHANRLMNQHIN